MVAIAAFFILVIVSLRPIRSEAYEIFFYTHFIAVLWVYNLYTLNNLLTDIPQNIPGRGVLPHVIL